MELVPTLAGVGIVFVPLDVVPGTEAILIHVRNVDCAEWFRNGHGSCQFRYVLPIVFIHSTEDCRVVDHIVLGIPFEEDSVVVVGVGATLVLTEELPGLQSHEVGGYELGPTHEYGHPQEEDYSDLPRSKLSDCLEDILVEKLHLS